MRNILYISRNGKQDEKLVIRLEHKGYTVVRYKIDDTQFDFGDELCQKIKEQLEKDFYYFVCSPEYQMQVSTACIASATKYVILVGENTSTDMLQDYIGCYYIPQAELEQISLEEAVFGDKEWEIYNIINELWQLKKQYNGEEIIFKNLKNMKDEQEMCRLTDCFFARKEEEKELSFRLKDLLLEYIDALLKQKSWDSWRELVLWNKRLGSRDLKNNFWQFYILWKILFVYAEETKEYYENGTIPSVLQFDSMEQLTETYFATLFLLRRLEYDVESETELEVVDYIIGNNLSGIFIKHIIDNNQIENKEKVRLRLEELLTVYEQ